MKITQINDKVIITYINFKKGKVHISIEHTFRKKKIYIYIYLSYYTNFNYLAKEKELWLHFYLELGLGGFVSCLKGNLLVLFCRSSSSGQSS